MPMPTQDGYDWPNPHHTPPPQVWRVFPTCQGCGRGMLVGFGVSPHTHCRSCDPKHYGIDPLGRGECALIGYYVRDCPIKVIP